MNENLNILEINENEFEDKVLVASSSSLVLVDFWAPWCGPCKQLTPLLEKIINTGKGKVKLVKINIDKNQQIASQMSVQSIPAVFAFKDGQPVDAFQGIIPEKKIIEFIEKSLGEKLIEDFTEFYQNILSLFETKKYKKTLLVLEDFLAKNPNNYQGLAFYIECLGHMENYSEAENFSKSLDEETLKNTFVKSAIQKISIKKINSVGPGLDELKNEYENNPKNIKAVIKLADKYFAENMFDECFELLLQNYKNNKDVIKKKNLELFETLGNTDINTIKYRKKLSSLFFV
jgi:putative thioredoxin